MELEKQTAFFAKKNHKHNNNNGQNRMFEECMALWPSVYVLVELIIVCYFWCHKLFLAFQWLFLVRKSNKKYVFGLYLYGDFVECRVKVLSYFISRESLSSQVLRLLSLSCCVSLSTLTFTPIPFLSLSLSLAAAAAVHRSASTSKNSL